MVLFEPTPQLTGFFPAKGLNPWHGGRSGVRRVVQGQASVTPGAGIFDSFHNMDYLGIFGTDYIHANTKLETGGVRNLYSSLNVKLGFI
jgi:hypothetical protein